MRAVRVLLAVLGLLVALPATASAHPVGNFTINHFTRLTVASDEIRVHYVLDMAEIPTVSERQRIDTDDDGELTADETDAYLAGAAPILAAGLELTVDGDRRPWRLPGAARIEFAPGQAGLSTLRLELDLVTELPAGHPGATIAGAFADDTFADRIGWREVIVVGTGVTMLDSTAATTSVSDELRAYPADGIDDPIDQRAATFRARLTPAADAGSAPPAAPRATNDSPDLLAGLLVQGSGSPAAALLAVLVSLGLGVAHAASPGHGKTLVAAYLIGTRGTPRQALTLGLTVAVTHTIGVFVLGGVVLGASELLVPERVIEWLAMAAGVVVIGMGIWLIGRACQREPRHSHSHAPGHAHHHHPHDAGQVPGRSVAIIGLAGGLVPSASALIVLLVAVSQGQLALGIVLIAAFGIGMALTLGAISLAVVLARQRVERGGLAFLARPVVSRIGNAVPVASALVVLSVGIVLTLEALGRIA